MVMNNACCTAITFSLCGQRYCVDINYVKEVQSLTEITPVPRTVQCIKGLASLRSQIVLIVDILRLFDNVQSVSDHAQSAVILKSADEITRLRLEKIEFDPSVFGDKSIGILADEIDDVINFTIAEIEPPPVHLSLQGLRYIEGVISINGDPCSLLKPGLLLTGIAEATIHNSKGVTHA